MSLIDLPGLKLKLEHIEYLAGEAHESFWQHLVNQIAGFRRPSDTFTVPFQYEPYAWRRTYAIYEELKARAEQPPPAQDAADAVRANLFHQDWNLYLAAFEYLNREHEHCGFGRDQAVYCGLESIDMYPPRSDDPADEKYGARRRDWQEVAERVVTAAQRWKELTPELRRAIPLEMASRRARVAAAALEKRFSAVESKQVA